MNKFDSSEYKRSRNSYAIQCTLEYFVSLLVTDAYLTRLLSNIGISDSLTGIISSFITLAFVVQLMSIFVVRIKMSTKKLVMIFDTISIFFFMFMYLIPFLPLDRSMKTILVMMSILMAYVCKYLILSIFFKWANSYVEPTKRASYSAVKEIISLFSGMIFTAVIGYIIDRYESLGNLEGGFLFIAASILILNICNFISIAMIKKESPSEHAGDNTPFSVIIKTTLGNKNFRSIVLLTILWDVSRYFTIGFLGVFKYKNLLMSVFLVQIVNIIANLARIAVSKPIGRYSDKTSYAKGFKLGLYLAAAAFFINIFTTKSTWGLIVIYTILMSCSTAGTNQNSYNITYSYVKSEYIVQAMAIKNCIGGLFGFGASILGGKILDIVQNSNNIVFGIHIYGQQILSAISFVIILIAIVFIKKVIEKQNIIVQ